MKLLLPGKTSDKRDYIEIFKDAEKDTAISIWEKSLTPQVNGIYC